MRPNVIGLIENVFTSLDLKNYPFEAKQLPFTTATGFLENGTAYRMVNALEPQYVGPPNLEMDNNWKRLISSRALFHMLVSMHAEANFYKIGLLL